MSRQFCDWSSLLVPLAVLAAPAHAAGFMSIAQTQALLFPGANNFIEQPLLLDQEQRARIKQRSGLRQRWERQQVWRAERDGVLLGWFIVDDVIGKHEFITYATAISLDGKVLGVDILRYRETHGGQVRDPAWRKHLEGKTLGDRFKLDEDIPNISGATLSCRNVIDGVKRLLVMHALYLKA